MGAYFDNYWLKRTQSIFSNDDSSLQAAKIAACLSGSTISRKPIANGFCQQEKLPAFRATRLAILPHLFCTSFRV